jgi:arabinose-5-phosphate isomerase
MPDAQKRHEPTRRGHPDRAERADAAEIVAMGRRVLAEEAVAINALHASLGQPFATAVRWIYGCSGRILVTGLGKSGLIARKIAATMTSTGTPALFVHPVEALHGDLGIASAEDLLLALSRSGANEEILMLQSSLRSMGVRSIAIRTRAESRLACEADLALITPVDREACPLELTPTTSTTAALALGDALAMTLLELRDFQREDFALFHPSGALGRALRTTVSELMHSGSEMPTVRVGSSLRDALVELSAKRLGCTLVLANDGALAGFLSDGDLKRILLTDDTALQRPVDDFMSRHPRSVAPDCLARAALRSMEGNEGGAITQLVVVEGTRPVGVVHLHDILRLGFAV